MTHLRERLLDERPLSYGHFVPSNFIVNKMVVSIYNLVIVLAHLQPISHTFTVP